MRITQQHRKIATWILLTIVVLALAFVQFTVKPIRVVDNGSMEPTLPVGTFIIPWSTDHVSVGDIITFRDDDGYVATHRVIGVAVDGSISTKGDANTSPDLHLVPLRMDHVLGIVPDGFGLPWWTVAIIVGAILVVVLILSVDVEITKKDKTEDIIEGETLRTPPPHL